MALAQTRLKRQNSAGETVASTLARACQLLRPSRTASLDAQLLLGHVLGTSRSWVLAHPDSSVPQGDLDCFWSMIQRRKAGEPVAYLRGHVEWLGLDLVVSPQTLIPRPETELLVERAVEIARRRRARVISDIGTGSGAIAIGVARSLPDSRVFAVDVSGPALAVARQNVERFTEPRQVTLLLGDLLDPLSVRPELIVANLPYLSIDAMRTLSPDVRHEPEIALYGGPSGLVRYSRLLTQLRERRWEVALVLEIDPHQAEEIQSSMRSCGFLGTVRFVPDYAGDDRMVVYEPESDAR